MHWISYLNRLCIRKLAFDIMLKWGGPGREGPPVHGGHGLKSLPRSGQARRCVRLAWVFIYLPWPAPLPFLGVYSFPLPLLSHIILKLSHIIQFYVYSSLMSPMHLLALILYPFFWFFGMWSVFWCLSWSNVWIVVFVLILYDFSFFFNLLFFLSYDSPSCAGLY